MARRVADRPAPDRRSRRRSLPAWLAGRWRKLPATAPVGCRLAAAATDASRPPPAHGTSCSRDWPARRCGWPRWKPIFARAVEQEKLAALKEFAYGAGHEINNPLANISARAQTLLKDEHDPERRQKLAAINSQAFRAHEMIADLMLFAQPPEWQSTRVALGPLLAELESAWRRSSRPSKRTAFERARRGRVARRLGRSRRHWPWHCARWWPTRWKHWAAAARSRSARRLPARLIRRRAASDDRATDAVAIRVRDDGPGIDPAVRPRIFDPFFSGREAGRGLGFGLPKCWRIVTALGGRIDVGSEPTAGATFTLVLPLAASAT